MSKAALYAGLGQGLMSLGQGVSKAIETMTLEEMRQKNLEQNWAREDARDAKRAAREDARWARQDELAAEQRKYQRGRDAKADERQQALMDIAAEERADKKNSKVVRQERVKDNGKTYDIGYNADGTEVLRSEVVTKERTNNYDFENKMKVLQAELDIAKENGDEQKVQALISQMKSLSGYENPMMKSFLNWASSRNTQSPIMPE